MPRTRVRGRGSDGQRGRCGDRKAKVVFTECWKSWSQVFALSSEALSVALLKTSRAEITACMSAIVFRVNQGLQRGMADMVVVKP